MREIASIGDPLNSLDYLFSGSDNIEKLRIGNGITRHLLRIYGRFCVHS